MTKEKALDKIKKLLALASSPNENEARAAMIKAQALMLEYSVSLDAEKIITYTIYENKYTIPVILFAQTAQMIASCFGSFALWTRDNKDIEIVGFKDNNNIAIHGLDCIFNQGYADFKTLPLIKRLNLAYDIGFWTGFRDSIFNKFKEESKEIIKYPEVYEVLMNMRKTIPKTIKLEAGREGGLQSGQNAQLRAGVSNFSVKESLK